MTRYFKIECPRCLGKGKLRHYLVLERTCPLCHGAGVVPDPTRPLKMLPQPEAEIKILRPQSTAELLANTIPLGKKTSSGFLTRRRAMQNRPPPVLLGKPDALPSESHFADDEDWHGKEEFVEGAEPGRRDYAGRMRQR